MFRRNQRITSSVFRRVFKDGKKKHTPSAFLVYLQDDTLEAPSFGTVVPKKVEKSAVGRNRIKRKLRPQMKSIENLKPGYYIMVLKNRDVSQVDLKQLFNLVK